MKINPKTARSHIQKLLQVNFLSLDNRTNIIFVRSKYKIIPKAKRISKSNLKIDLKQLEYFTEFLIAGVVAYIVKKRMTKQKNALQNDGAQRRFCKLHRRYNIGVPISLTYIANFLGKSVSWVDKYKQKARRLKWIEVRRNWSQTNIEWRFRKEYLSYWDIRFGRAKKYRGNLHLIDSGLLTPVVTVGRRKKSV